MQKINNILNFKSYIALLTLVFMPTVITADTGCLWESPEGCMYLIYQGVQYVNCGDGYYSDGYSGLTGECPGMLVEVN